MQFADEYEYLVHLICSAINNTVPEDIPDNLSIEKVLEYGTESEVANIAFLAVTKLRNPPDESILSRWEQVYYKAVKRDNAQKKARIEILDALHSHGIYTLEVQGTVVKKYYPQSHLRMMSDLDFIVPVERFDELEGVMQSIGYETNDPNGIEIDAYKGNIAVELHTRFFDTKSITRVALNHPYSYAVCGEDYSATVTDTIFYLFHLLHTIKHCDQMGSGLRRIIDLYYLENALKDKVDYNYIDDVLKKYGFYETKQKLLAVKDHWFYGIEPKENISEFEREILESGNHGKEENFYKHKFAREQAEGKHFVKLRYVLEFLFPEKEILYHAYPFCKKHHLPLVLCWVYRGTFVFNPQKLKSMKTVFSRTKIKVNQGKTK